MDLSHIKPIKPIRARGQQFKETIVIFGSNGIPIVGGDAYECRDFLVEKQLVTESAIKYKQTLPSQLIKAAKNKSIFYGLTIKFYDELEVE